MESIAIIFPKVNVNFNGVANVQFAILNLLCYHNNGVFYLYLIKLINR